MQRGAARRGQGASIAHSCEDTGLVVARSGPGGSPRAVMATRTPRPRSTEDLAQPGAPGPPWCACDHKQLRAGWIAVCGRYSIRHKGRMSKWKRRCDAVPIVLPAIARPTQRIKPFTFHLNPFERDRRRACTRRSQDVGDHSAPLAGGAHLSKVIFRGAQVSDPTTTLVIVEESDT